MSDANINPEDFSADDRWRLRWDMRYQVQWDAEMVVFRHIWEAMSDEQKDTLKRALYLLSAAQKMITSASLSHLEMDGIRTNREVFQEHIPQEDWTPLDREVACLPKDLMIWPASYLAAIAHWEAGEEYTEPGWRNPRWPFAEDRNWSKNIRKNFDETPPAPEAPEGDG